MTVSSTTTRVRNTGNGAVDTYSYTFKIFDQDELLVTVRDTDNAETTLTITTDYTVTGVGSVAGGTVVLVDNNQAWIDADGDLASGYILTIRRVRDLLQETDLRNQGDSYPETIEDEFDKQLMIDQQQQEEIDKSVKLPETVLVSDFSPTLPSDIVDAANKAPVVNASGTGWADAADWPTSTAISGASASATAAAASATAAAASAAAAATSETNAATSATAAAASATTASTQATNAATSATNAATSATAAATSETNAAASATTATTQATNASASATTATTQATNAANSATAAATSETNAATSATNAATSATNAANSATAAAASVSAATGLAEYADDAAYVTANGAAEDGDIYYNTTIDKVKVYANGAWTTLGGGGGGSALYWVEHTNAPVPTVDNNMLAYAFQFQLQQELYALVRVPTSYVSGSPIAIRTSFYTSNISDGALMVAQSTLLRTGTDAATSTTNQRTTTNSAVDLSIGALANKINSVTLDITSSTGQINGVSVSAGDLIVVRMYRSDLDNTTEDLMVPVYGAEVTFA